MLSTNIQIENHDSNSVLCTPRYAAGCLDVTEGTLAVWRSTGRHKLPFVKIGSKVRYRRADLEAFIDRNLKTQTA